MGTHLQAIIGTDKKNPNFTIFRNTREKTIDVYFGTSLFRVVKDIPDNAELNPDSMLQIIDKYILLPNVALR